MEIAPRRTSRRFSRRQFLGEAAALGVAALLGPTGAVAAEPPPEVRKIHLVKVPAICLAPQYVAEELLRLEGFSEIEYVEIGDSHPARVVYSGYADFTQDTSPTMLPALDAGAPVVALAGLHAGCYELVAHPHIRAVRDLRGKAVAIVRQGGPEHLFLASILAYVGIDPRKDIQWVVTNEYAVMMTAFIDRKVDAILGFAPQPQQLRAQRIGRVILNTATDRPWSQYFCCIVVGRRDFVARYPVATKRAIRAFLKAADICAQRPEQAARLLVEKGYQSDVRIALEVLKELPYNRWRDAEPEDTMRFFALRLHEIGMVKSTPEKLIAQGTDWRFLNEIKKELKA
jgi:NitT/TauT family transport system substrate-binding protein